MRVPVHAVARSGESRGERSRVARGLLLVVLSVVGVLAISASGALALKTHVFQSNFNASDAPTGAHAPLRAPWGAAVDNSTSLMDSSVGDIYVADSANNVVDKFNSSGAYLSQIEVPSPFDVAVDEANGDIYVSSYRNGVVDKFDSSGNVVASFGTGGQLNGSGTPQEAFEPEGVAVAPATGELFVADIKNNVIDVFSSSGAYLRQFPSIREPEGVAIDSAGNVFVTSFSAGTAVYDLSGGLDTAYGGGTGLLSTFSSLGVAVDPVDNDVYVADYESGQVVQYDFSGDELSRFGSEQLALPIGVGVSAATGDVYAVSRTHADVALYGPLVTLAEVTTEASSGVGKTTATLHGSVNPEKVAVSKCAFEYRSEAEASFTHTAACDPEPGSGDVPVAVSASLSTLLPGTTYRYRLAAVNANGTNRGQEESFTTEVAVQGVSTGAAEDVTGRTAKLTGSLAPDGTDAHYYFQYGTEAGVYGSTSPAPPGTDAGSAEESVPAHTELSGLEPNTTYHYRLVAENTFGPSYGEDESFTTNAYPAVAAEWVANVASSSATLQAQLNPGGGDTTYHFEYGATSGYGSSAPVPDSDAGGGRGEVLAGVHVQGLAPGAVYHYRVVATNGVGTVDGADHVFDDGVGGLGVRVAGWSCVGIGLSGG